MNFSTIPSLIADAGIPMLGFEWWVMVWAFIPVIVVETWQIGKKLNIPKRDLVSGVLIANIVSTIIGIPLAWGIMVGLEIGVDLSWEKFHFSNGPVTQIALFPLECAWLPPDEFTKSSPLYWKIPIAITVLFVPCFFLSVLIERWICWKMWEDVEEKARIRKSVFRANLTSYGLLFAIGLGLTLYRVWKQVGF